MEPERWRQVETLFQAALEQPPVERKAWLEAREEDAEVVWEVASLLAADSEEADGDGAVEKAVRQGLEHFERSLTHSLVGRRLGPYRLVDELGSGGTSTVYLAERADGSYQGQVAVKLLHRGTETVELLARFQMERQILASLDHPNIARLLDAGTTDEGRPYFVMESVFGERLDEFADRLPVPQRLELFGKICHAVQHAHRTLIIHRDLKPSNILVTAEGEPKLLDFGIARPLDTALSGGADATVTVSRRMTPGYASPEQLRGATLTTATDIYSLGVLLYRLLAGRHPYLEQEETYSSADELARRIVDRLPPRPSTMAPPEDRRAVRGDLDNVVLKAMAADAEERYGTVAALAEDLRRHQAQLPVLARRPTVTYRLVRFVRRQRWAVAAALVAVLVLLSFTIFSRHQYRQAARERDNLARTLSVLEGIFELSEPARAKGSTLTARELLDQGRETIDKELATRPRIRAHLGAILGRSYFRMGLVEEAKAVLEDSVVIFEQAGTDPAEHALALHRLADVVQAQGEYQAAEEYYRQALTLRRGVFGQSHPEVAAGLNGLADALHDQGRYEEAEPLYREALTMRQAFFSETHPDGHPEVADSLNDLALLFHDRADYATAEPLYRKALEMRRRLLDPQHPDLAMSLNNLASLLRSTGDMEEAETLFREAVDINRQVLGERNQTFAGTLQNLAMLLLDRGDVVGARERLEEVLSIQDESRDEDHPDRATTLHNLGITLERGGDLPAAARRYREAADLYQRTLKDGHPWIAFPLVGLGQLLLTQGAAQRQDLEEAEAALRQGVAIRRATLEPGHWRTAEAENLWGAALAALGRRDEGLPLLQAGYRQLLESRGEDDRRTREARLRLESWQGKR